jgi:hypothetical protein
MHSPARLSCRDRFNVGSRKPIPISHFGTNRLLHAQSYPHDNPIADSYSYNPQCKPDSDSDCLAHRNRIIDTDRGRHSHLYFNLDIDPNCHNHRNINTYRNSFAYANHHNLHSNRYAHAAIGALQPAGASPSGVGTHQRNRLGWDFCQRLRRMD